MYLNKVITWGREKLNAFLSLKGKLLLYFLVVVAPFATYPLTVNGMTIHPREIRGVCFYSFAIIICSYLQKNRWLRYFIIWCVANWWLNFFLLGGSYRILTNIFSAFVIYIGFKKLLETGFLKSDTILKIICLMILFQCVWVIMQMFNFDPVFYPVTASGIPLKTRMPLCGFSGNPALLGVFLSSFSFLFLEYFKIKKIPILFFVALIMSLLLKNATTIMAFTAGSLFYLFNKSKSKKKYIYGIGVLILTALFFAYIKFPNTDRLYIWKKLIFQGIKVRPLVGSGMGIFSHLVIIDKTGTPWYEAHNDYLQMVLELGCIGFILFSGFILSKFTEFFKSVRNNKQVCLMSCLVAFLVSCVSLFSMHIAQLSFYIIVLLTVLENTYAVKVL